MLYLCLLTSQTCKSGAPRSTQRCVLKVLLWHSLCATATRASVRGCANDTTLCNAGKNGPIDLCSWAQEYPALREAANNISFWDKKGQVIWRGRHEENSWRDHVR